MSADGRYIAFTTDEDLVPSDTGQFRDNDVYLRDPADRHVFTGDPAGPGQRLEPADLGGRRRDRLRVGGLDHRPERHERRPAGSVRRRHLRLRRRSRSACARQRRRVRSRARGDYGALDQRARPLRLLHRRTFRPRRPRLPRRLCACQRSTGATERIVGTDGLPGNGNDVETAALSADAHYVVFDSSAPDLVPGDVNGFEDVFLQHARRRSRRAFWVAARSPDRRRRRRRRRCCRRRLACACQRRRLADLGLHRDAA